MTDNFTLSDHFSQYFNLSIANTTELKQEVFRIRYQVYCEELGYEPLDRFPDQMERDTYDERSIHCILQHKPTGIYAGCVRLVLSDQNNPEAKFPFENVCSDHLIDFNQTARSHFGEVSRLAVISRFRKREGEQKTPSGLIVFDEKKKKKEKEEQNQQRRFPVIALSLYLAASSLGLDLGLDYAVTLMEPRLARHLKMSGLISRPVGQVIDFHGKRGPFAMERQEVLAGFSKNTEVNGLFQNIQANMRRELSHKFYNHNFCTT
jgi:N-acyl amino acid synthase of PEP-CTERM/exosortase system